MGPSFAGEQVRAFVPLPLPPQPPLVLDERLHEEHDRALLALGRLDSLSLILPDATSFLYTYVRKEAVLSSQIEGTQSSLSDLLLYEIEEAPGVPFDDVREVSCYVRALEHGLQRLREGFPLSNRLLREIHGVLLAHGRGSDKQPGHFRRSQNWIGGARPGVARFVPPPPDAVEDCMAALERFLHDVPARTPSLVKAALAHVQFETIHPFLDGNGRVGRLLITLLLCSERVLEQPMLYLSLYLKRYRDTYYEMLQRVRLDGAWEEWLDFFLRGMRETAEGAAATAKRLVELFRDDRARIEQLGRVAGSALRVHDALQRQPVLTAAAAARRSGLTVPTVNAMLKRLVDLGLVREITGRRWHRVFAYDQYLRLMSEGTEPVVG